MNYINNNKIYSKNQLKKKIEMNDNESYIYMLYIKYYNISLIYYFFFYNVLKLLKSIKNIKFNNDIDTLNNIINEYHELIIFESYNDDIILKEEILNCINILKDYDNIIQYLKKYIINNDDNEFNNIINNIYFIKDYNYIITYDNLSMYNNVFNEILILFLLFINNDNEQNFEKINNSYKKITNKNILIKLYDNIYKLYINFLKNINNDILNIKKTDSQTELDLNKQFKNTKIHLNIIKQFITDSKKWINESNEDFSLFLSDVQSKIDKKYKNINNEKNILKIFIKYFKILLTKLINENIIKDDNEKILTILDDIIHDSNDNKVGGKYINDSIHLKKQINNKLIYKIDNVMYYNFNKLFKLDTELFIDVHNNYFNKIYILISSIYKIILKTDTKYLKNFYNIINILNIDINNLNEYTIQRDFNNFIHAELNNPRDIIINNFFKIYRFNIYKINKVLNTLFNTDTDLKSKFIYIYKLYIYNNLIELYKKIIVNDCINYDYSDLITNNDNIKLYKYNNKYSIKIMNIYDIINNIYYNYNIKLRDEKIKNILYNNYNHILNNIDNINLHINYFNIEYISHDEYLLYNYYFYLIKNILKIIKHNNNKNLIELYLLKYFKLYYKIKILIYEINIINNDIFSSNSKLFYYIIKLKIIKHIVFKKKINNKKLYNMLIYIFNKYY